MITQNTNRSSRRLKCANRKVYKSLLMLVWRYTVQLNIDKYLLVLYIGGLLGGNTRHGSVISSVKRESWWVKCLAVRYSKIPVSKSK